jgi:uncharacterized protein YpmB
MSKVKTTTNVKKTKKVTLAPSLTVEELNSPVKPTKTVVKPKRHTNWIGIFTLLLLTVIAVSSSYIAYELKNTSYRISVVTMYTEEKHERNGTAYTQ